MAKIELSRRRLFTKAGKFVAGAALGAGVVALASRAAMPGTAEQTEEWPWPYVELDPARVAERAYEAFYAGHCMYGTFEGIIGELRDQVGHPYTLIPTEMMEYGRGGMVGWGTLCGALNGAAAAITLVTANYGPIITELAGWYTQTALPIYQPRNPRLAIEAASVAGSPLCHVSVTQWCNASGFGSQSAERKERCARLTADVASRAVELLNLFARGEFSPSWAAPASVSECLGCHGSGGVKDNVFGQMDCLQCHERH